MAADNSDSPQPPGGTRYPRPTFETLFGRALRLRCPRCGEGKLYRGMFRMNHRCPVCDFLIERPSGYYLGSMYVNYGTTAWITTIGFLVGRLYFNIPGQILLWPLGAFCLIFPTLFFRHARAYWLALDCHLDSAVLEEGFEDETTPSEDHTP